MSLTASPVNVKLEDGKANSPPNLNFFVTQLVTEGHYSVTNCLNC